MLYESSPISTKSALIILLFVCFCFYGAGSVRTGFSGTDELRYGEVAKEMDSLPHMFYLRYQGNPYPDKPPLYFWMVKAGYAISGGPAPWALRAPLIFSTLITVLLTFGIGRRLFDDRIALLGAAFYGLSFRVTWSAHIARLDPPLVMFTTLALYIFVCQFENLDSGRRPSFKNVLAFWTAMALGFLIKGPLALLVPLLTIGLYRLIRKQWKGTVGVTTLAGVGLFMAIVLLLWIVPGAWFGRHVNYFQTIIGQEVVARSTTPWRHVKHGLLDPMYYFGRLAAEFLPGSLFLPGCFALWLALRRKRQMTPGLVFTWVWFIGIFIFFTFMRSKRGQYILPLYPAAGLLAGHFVATLRRKDILSKEWFFKPAKIYAFATFVLAVVLLLPILDSKLINEFNVLPGLGLKIILIGGLVFCGASIFGYARRRDMTNTLAMVLAVLPVVLIPASMLYFPRGYDDTMSKEITKQISRYAAPGDRVFMLRSEPQLAIYGDYYMSEFDTAEGAEHLGLTPYYEKKIESKDAAEGFVIEKQSKSTYTLKHESLTAFVESDEPLLGLLTGEEFAALHVEFPGQIFYILEVYPHAKRGKDGGAILISNKPRHEWKLHER